MLPSSYHDAISAKRAEELIPDELELEESGQLSIGVEGEQRAFPTLAPEGKPAPIADPLERPADDELERRRATTSAEDDRRARGVVLFNGQEITREAYDRIRGVTPAEERGGPHAIETKPKSSRSPGANLRTYRCGDCGRKLTAERWVYSRHTGARYCTPGEGCQTPGAYTKADRARARAQKEG